MDVERTMGFILEQQAKSAVWQQKTDRKMAAIQKLLLAGMKMLARHDREHAAFRKEILTLKREIAALAKRTDERFAQVDARFAQSDARIERLLAALLRQRPNGRH